MGGSAQNTGAGLELYGKTHFNNPGQMYLQFATPGFFQIRHFDGATIVNHLRINSNGDVGIGTITPGAKLEVAGQVKITGGSPGLNKVLTSDADGLASWQTAGGGSSKWDTATGGINYSGGMVGIGTTTPSARFDLGGGSTAVRMVTTPRLRDLPHTKAVNSAGIFSGLRHDDTIFGGYFDGADSHGFISTGYNATPRKFSIGTASSIDFSTAVFNPHLTVSNSGNVGIGTVSPGYKLEVAGTIFSSTGGYRFPDGTTQITAAAGGGSSKWDTATGGINYSGGLVGIGTTTPSQKLDVVGNIALPNTAGSTTGVIYKGADRFIHNFAGVGSSGSNTFMGIDAGNFTMGGGGSHLGSYNTAQGHSALKDNTTGWQNSAQGFQTLFRNTTGYFNNAQGSAALFSNTIGYQNSAQGVAALYYNTEGYNNTAQGTDALLLNTTGYNNTAQGYKAGGNILNGNSNTFVGYEAGNGSQLNSAVNSMALGNGAFTTASHQVVIGNTSVTQLQFNGALMPRYGGAYNAGTSGFVLTSQGASVAPQWAAPGGWLLTGNAGLVDATNFIGTTAAAGDKALNFRVNNEKAGRIDDILNNTFFGYKAGNSSTIRSSNTAVGSHALSAATNADFNTAIGHNTGKDIVDGHHNTFVGYNTGLGITSGGKNTIIGANVTGLAAGLSNNILLANGDGAVKLRIINDGRVALGSFTPTNSLSFSMGSAHKIAIEDQGPGAAGMDLTVAASSTAFSAVNANVAGGSHIIQAGVGTGTGTSTILFQNGTTLGSGGTLQTMSTKMTILGSGNVGIGTISPTSKLQVVGLIVYADNDAAVAGGLTAGAFYRTGGNPSLVAVVY